MRTNPEKQFLSSHMNNLRFFTLAALLLAPLAVLHAADASAKAAAGKPNIIFILADDLGWKDVGYAGSTFYRTPNIDRLVRGGMQFSQAYSAACVCSPSRGAVYSGKNPARTALTTVWDGGEGPDERLFDRSKDQGGGNQYLEARHRHALPQSETTFAQVLAGAGYVTGFFGKWHCGEFAGYQPTDRGFQHGQGFRLPAAGGHTRGHWGRSYRLNTLANLPDLKPDDYLADVLTAETVKFIHAHKSRPFHVVLSHYLVHAPLQPKLGLVASYDNARKTDQNNPEYAAMVESLDQSVGRVMDALEQEGLTENTMVVFTSDNGGLTPENTSNYPLMGGKSFPFEAGVRVPLVIRWPAVIKPGTSCQQRVIGMDFYPTFLAAAGLPLMPRQHTDGVSLLPLLSGSGELPERPLVFHFPHYTHATGPNTVLIENDWKLIWFYNDETGRYLLYNLAEDPFEQHDLSAALPDRVRTLDERLSRLLDDMKAQMPRKNPTYDPEAKQLMNRGFTLNLATKERKGHAAQIKASEKANDAASGK
jgi:arylsulfatase A-like enzyme